MMTLQPRGGGPPRGPLKLTWAAIRPNQHVEQVFLNELECYDDVDISHQLTLLLQKKLPTEFEYVNDSIGTQKLLIRYGHGKIMECIDNLWIAYGSRPIDDFIDTIDVDAIEEAWEVWVVDIVAKIPIRSLR